MVQGPNVITNEVNGERGNIWVFWRKSPERPNVLSSSKQDITLDFSGDYITGVHASSDAVARRSLWSQLWLGFIYIPWLMLGDFNCVMHLDEKKGGRPIKEIYMNEFRSWISDNGLVEAYVIGKKYTWTNCRSGIHRIVSKHDRAVINDAWYDKYANWRCKALPRVCSDHFPLFGFAFDSPRPNRAPFRIHKMCLSHPSFLDFIKKNWSGRLDGAPPFVFTSKLKRLKEALKVSDAIKVVNEDEIKDYIIDHYRAKFNGGGVHIDPKLFEYEHESISAAKSAFMDAIPSLDEVKEAFFDLGADSASGPDGFTGLALLKRVLMILRPRKGVFSVKSVKAAIRAPAEVSPTAALFTRSVVHPTLSVQYWKLFNKQCCATEDNIIKNTDLVASYKVAKGRSRMIKDLWLVANLAIVTELWKLRNKAYYADMYVRRLEFKGRVHQSEAQILQALYSN
ncbi:uncharacterized protein LOC113331258 [Papaver somniferum]|uniref:uncharacterized protein LOC113331258 n=1 Tax=Papaver somniferum TaxID=3469 RepID=UPI000E6FC9CD|nr:uncharacterized protein LOC113331258 [Papaver somniferum]